MTAKKKILLSARDPGAVGSIRALLILFRQNPLYTIQLVASGVAAKILKEQGERPIVFSLQNQRDNIDPQREDTQPLLLAAENLLQKIRPDIVITSLSSFGVGIDEALLATAKVPTYALQDFWGDVNLGLGVAADLYLTIDNFAVNLTKRLWSVAAKAVGAPKYSLYNRLDIPEMRQKSRKLCDIDSDKKIISWFGQSPEIPGHEETFLSLIQALKKLDHPFCLLLREHPKFLQAKNKHIAMSQKLGIECYDATNKKSTEDWLVASDLVITPFSLCGLDHAHLSAYSPTPLGSVLYMMTEPQVRSFAKGYSGILKFPIVDDGIGCYLDDNKPEKILEALSSSLETKTVLRYFQNSKAMVKKFDFTHFLDIINKSN